MGTDGRRPAAAGRDLLPAAFPSLVAAVLTLIAHFSVFWALELHACLNKEWCIHIRLHVRRRWFPAA